MQGRNHRRDPIPYDGPSNQAQAVVRQRLAEGCHHTPERPHPKNSVLRFLLHPRFCTLAQVSKYAEEQATIAAEATALTMQSRQKEAANNQLWEQVHEAAQVLPNRNLEGIRGSRVWPPKPTVMTWVQEAG